MKLLNKTMKRKMMLIQIKLKSKLKGLLYNKIKIFIVMMIAVDKLVKIL